MRIHLIGVGGTAMGNLAAMLKEIGHTVTGSDKALYPPMSERLKEWGIEARPFSVRNLEGSDLVIIGNVISRGNAEAEAVLNERIPYLSMPEALFEFFLKEKEVIVAAGTHGKTTTAFLMDHVLSVADCPPGLFVGGLRADGQAGYRVSDSRYFVIEGDEYDSAFFDKGAKFLHYRPRYLILTSVEYDHADIYATKALYRQSFERLLRMIPSEGLVAACVSDKGVRTVLKDFSYSRIAPYLAASLSKKAWKDLQTLQTKEHSLLSKQSKQSLKKSDKKSSHIKRFLNIQKEYGELPKAFRSKGREVEFSGYAGRIRPFSMIGEHNMANAAGVLQVAEALGLDEERVREALRSFPGVLRRQQIRMERKIRLPLQLSRKSRPEKEQEKDSSFNIIFMEDFAHHPTAVARTLEAVRLAWPRHRIHALYEPRSATSHRNVFQKEYVEAFKQADFVYICDIFNKNKVSKGKRLNVERLIRDMDRERKKSPEDAKKTAFFAKNPEALQQILRKKMRSLYRKPKKASRKNAKKGCEGDVILAMSNGNFGGIYPRIEEWLSVFSP